MPPPGRLERTFPCQTGRTAGTTFSIACRGRGTYILIFSQQIYAASMSGRMFGGVGSPGRPNPFTIVAHKDTPGPPFQFNVRTGTPMGRVSVQLWLAPPGTPLPRAGGWQASDSWRHKR